MRNLFFSLILSMSAVCTCHAVHPNMMRFHCENDTVKIQNLLEEGLNTGYKDPGKLMIFYGEQLMNTPYVAKTLEGNDEYLTINIDELDCTTFMETCAALTLTTLSKRKSWRDYANNLENLRYKGGEMNGYASRLHYISDWIINNAARGNVKEITQDFPNPRYVVKTLDFMSTHRDAYPALKDNEENLEGIKNMEMGYRSHRYPMLDKNALRNKNIVAGLKDGDIIALLTKTEGLDATHVGIIKKIDGVPHLLHASMGSMKVSVTDTSLWEYLRLIKTCPGVRVWRVIE